MRITINGLWAFTKWLMVFTVAYFGYNYFQNVHPIYTGKTSIDRFSYDSVDPGYEMNIIMKEGYPIQVDSIMTDDNNVPEYFYQDDAWYIKVKRLDGSYQMIKCNDILEIYYVKEGKAA